MAGPLKSLYLVLKGHWVSLAVLTEVTLAMGLGGGEPCSHKPVPRTGTP